MSAEAVNNPLPAGNESKSARKKRAKAEAAGQSQTTESPDASEVKTPEATNGDSSYFESPYVKELQKCVTRPRTAATEPHV